MPTGTRLSFTARTGSDTGMCWATILWATQLPKGSVRRQQWADRRSGEAFPTEARAGADARRGPARLLCAAAILHLALSVTVYALGRSAIFPGALDGSGVALAFASDGVRYRADAAALSEALRGGRVHDWVVADRPFHVKLYSVCFALFGPWLGFNVVGAEPLNALCYLSILILVFSLGREVFRPRAGLLAAGAVALWPSFLLHTTQFLKDPLVVAGTLALVLLLVSP